MSDDPVPTADSRADGLRDAFASFAEVAGAGAACPGADELWDAAAGRGERARVEAVVLHLGECGVCAAAWRVARDLQQAVAGARVLTGPRRWYRRTWVQVVAAAAALIFAAGLAVQLGTARREATAEFRGREGDWIRPLVIDGQPLERERCVLRWTPGPKGTVYDVRVLTEDLEPVARGRGLERAEFVVPAASLVRLPSGSRIVWQVTAHPPGDGTVDSRSFTSPVR